MGASILSQTEEAPFAKTAELSRETGSREWQTNLQEATSELLGELLDLGNERFREVTLRLRMQVNADISL